MFLRPHASPPPRLCFVCVALLGFGVRVIMGGLGGVASDKEVLTPFLPYT